MSIKRLWLKVQRLFWTLLKYGAILAIVATVAVSALNMTESGTMSDAGSEGIPGENAKEAAIDEKIHEKINEVRDRRALSELSYDDNLAEIARDHSEDMAMNEYYSHEDPSGDGFEARYQEAGYDCEVETTGRSYLTGAENIWKMTYEDQSFTAEEIASRAVSSWMDSEGHRENIVNEHWNNEGIGVAIAERDGGETEVYVTQNFC